MGVGCVVDGEVGQDMQGVRHYGSLQTEQFFNLVLNAEITRVGTFPASLC